MTSSLSRIKVIEGYPPVLPHKCAVCGTSESGIYLDFGLDLDFYGTVYLCLMNCFTEAANTVGYYSEKQYGEVIARNDELYQNVKVLEKRLEVYTDVARSVDRLSSLSLPHASKSTYTPPEQDTESDDTESESDDKGIERTESKSLKPANEQGSTNVQRDDSLDKLLDGI